MPLYEIQAEIFQVLKTFDKLLRESASQIKKDEQKDWPLFTKTAPNNTFII